MSVDSRVGVDGTLSGPEGEEMSEEVKKGVEMAKCTSSYSFICRLETDERNARV